MVFLASSLAKWGDSWVQHVFWRLSGSLSVPKAEKFGFGLERDVSSCGEGFCLHQNFISFGPRFAALPGGSCGKNKKCCWHIVGVHSSAQGKYLLHPEDRALAIAQLYFVSALLTNFCHKKQENEGVVSRVFVLWRRAPAKRGLHRRVMQPEIRTSRNTALRCCAVCGALRQTVHWTLFIVLSCGFPALGLLAATPLEMVICLMYQWCAAYWFQRFFCFVMTSTVNCW